MTLTKPVPIDSRDGEDSILGVTAKNHIFIKERHHKADLIPYRTDHLKIWKILEG